MVPIRSTLLLSFGLALPFSLPLPPDHLSPPHSQADSLPAWAAPLVGSWSCVGAFGSGKPLAADIHIAPSLGGRWLEYHHTDRAPGRYEASAHFGPLTATSTVMASTTIYDNFGGARRFHLTVSSAGLVLDRDTTAAGANVERFTFKARDDRSLWFAWEVFRDNRWVLGDSLGCRTAKG